MSPAEKEAFLDRAFEEFSALADSVEDASSRHGEREGRIAKAVFRNQLDIWLRASVREMSEGDWTQTVRWVEIFSEALSNENIVVASADDIDLLYCLVSYNFRQHPHAFEYYAQTGELLELLRICVQDRRLSSSEWNQDTLTKLYSFYDHEMSMVEGCLSRGEKDELEGFLDLPLDVRVSFAGLDERFAQAEKDSTYGWSFEPETIHLVSTANHREILHGYPQEMIPEKIRVR